MSKGNWSEWLGTQDATPALPRRPNYVALTDDTVNRSNNAHSIPALSNTHIHMAHPYPHYNPTTPSTSHYGQHQYHTPYYQHQYHDPLSPPTDYYSNVHRHKNKNKNKIKKKKKRSNHMSIVSPPARPPKPPNIATVSHTPVIASSKQYELIVSNVPSQIRAKELHHALNAQKCHLTDFYIPDYNEASTIIIIVKGFVQWRQLSKLTEIEIRGIKCPIKPKPLKSFSDNDASNNQNTKDQQKTQQKDNGNKEIVNDDNKDKEQHQEMDLISHLNALKDVIITQVDNDVKQQENIEQNMENDGQTIATIKCQDESNDVIDNNVTDNDVIDNGDNDPQNANDVVIKEEPHKANPCEEEPIINTDHESINENTNNNEEKKDTETDKPLGYDGLNVKLEVPDVPDIMISDEDEGEEEEEEEPHEDIFFVEDNSNTMTYNSLEELMEAEEPMDEPIQEPTVIPTENNTIHIQTKVRSVRKKKQSLSCTKPEKRLPLKSTKQTQKRICINSTKDTHKKIKATKRKSKYQYNSKLKSMKLDKHRIPKITIARDVKCGVSHETRSMFMSKLVELSCNYHDGMGLLQFKSIVMKIEDIMKHHCPTTTTYKLSCGQLLKKYRELKNIHRLTVYTKQEYAAKSKGVKAQTPIERLILTREQLEENGYPIKTEYLEDEYAEFVVAPHRNYHKDTHIYDLLAIDCEMCKTTKGNELTRISIVDSKLMVVYDKLVQPDNMITDYLTEWSGITPNLLKDVTRKVEDVHRDIFKFIDSNTILCGHSLENDLIAMKMVHYKVVDTAVLFMKRHRFRNNKRNIGYSIGGGGGRKISLKQLCDQYLNKKIQSTKGADGQMIGHSSVEDALAAMQLLQLQLKWEEERNRKLGISVPESMTQYTLYSDYKDNNDDGKHINNSNDDNDKVYKHKQKRMRRIEILMKQKHFKVINDEDEDDDIDILSLYGSNKKTKLDSSKHRFNPNSNKNRNRSDNVLPITSKEEMLSNLFEDDLFNPKSNTNQSTKAMDIDAGSNHDSDSEDDAILSSKNKTSKSMEATIIMDGQKRTVRMDRKRGHSMLKLDSDGNLISVADINKAKSRGIKRKLNEDHKYNTPKKKIKLSPSKLKTKRKPITNPTKITCDSDSDSESICHSDSIHSIKSLSKSPSLSDVPFSCHYNNLPPPPPTGALDIISISISDDEDKRNKDKKHNKRKKHKKYKSKKRSECIVKNTENCKQSKSKKRYEYEYIAPICDDNNNDDMEMRSRSRSKSKRKVKSKDKNLKAKAKSIILEWCHKYLNPLFKQKQITRKEYTVIAKKSVRKILESHEIWTAQNIKNLQTKSKHKVIDVIKAYVKKQTHS